MNKFILLVTVFAFAFILWQRAPWADLGANLQAGDQLTVVELFTSQSCSSCPPADRNLAELSENPNIIPLSFHVTYWNHLHWKDTLSHEFATKRQRRYAAHRNSRRVYTPQMIVNGGEEFVGSRRGDLSRALKNAASISKITLTQDGDTLRLSLPDITKGTYTLWLLGVKDHTTQDIPSGENRGRTVTYKNAVTSLKNLGAWDGSALTNTYTRPAGTQIDRYVILAQEKSYGPIAAAGITQTP